MLRDNQMSLSVMEYTELNLQMLTFQAPTTCERRRRW